MSKAKQLIREAFRSNTFKRDKNKCRICGNDKEKLDAHHITDRNLMPNGGYVSENGISLCPDCHEKAEHFHSTGTSLPGFSPEELYDIIGSSYTKAVKASEKI